MINTTNSIEVLWLEDPACQDVTRVGGKVANLSRLAALERVPAGFCLPTAVYTNWTAYPNQRMILDKMEATITNAYNSLAAFVHKEKLSVAVRSSAVNEDGQDSSFAGLFETYLNIVGSKAVHGAVQRCWASAQAARVDTYRTHQGQAATPVQLAVLIQELVAADFSAVVFSANPVTGNRDEIVINASWGLGESIVGGTVTPDTIVVRKTDGAIQQRITADKSRMTILAAAGVQEVAVPRPMRNVPVVTDEQAHEMAQLAQKLEQTMGWPVDLECAYADAQLYLLQCRPITTLS
ncbi:MAG: PEP/pyruvate-binding domain-containing protein [Caldilineaceae bacterium]|nr:PEP/pyruvate-binding domain-containing protein [Caldilineaceae bacterium]